MRETPSLPLFIVRDGCLWSAVDVTGEVRAQSSDRELLEETLPQIVNAIQTAAMLRQQMQQTGQIYRYDAQWIV